MSNPDAYLGHDVTAASILRHGADQARKHCAPISMIERFDAAASTVEATGRLPEWAHPSHGEKVTVLPVLREEEAE